MKKSNKARLHKAGLKPIMKFAVGYMSGEKELWVRNIRKFYLAKQFAEMVGGTVFIQHPEHNITDAIWPKQMQIFTWTDLNECFMHLARLKKDPPQPMFHYTVWCGDYGLGGLNWDSEYTGTNRDAALNAIKRAKSWMGMSKVCIDVLGRKEKHEEEEVEWDDDWIDESEYNDYVCPGSDFI